MKLRSAFERAPLPLRHGLVSLIGFAVDAVALKLALEAGLEPAWARVISLLLAMHTTFVLNGLHVFGGLSRGRSLARQWATYMVTNAFGNLCNYWIFVTLVSLHWRIVSTPAFALCASSLAAWGLNYTCTRHLVFGPAARLIHRRIVAIRRRPRSPSPAAPGSSRP